MVGVAAAPGRGCGCEDAGGALPPTPGRASPASLPPAPRTRTPGGHTKGLARRAGCGNAAGRGARDEVAGPRRPPRPRLCLPSSAPPPPAAPSPCSLPG